MASSNSTDGNSRAERSRSNSRHERSVSRVSTHTEPSNSELKRMLERLESRFEDTVKKVQTSTTPTSSAFEFKYKGNRMQHTFNSEVMADVEKVIDLLGDDSVGRAVRRLQDLKDKLWKRNKVIKIADRSAAGWSTIDEYLSDDLADDSADERKIRAAEERALTKKRKRGDGKSSKPSVALTRKEEKSSVGPACLPVPVPPPQTIYLRTDPVAATGRHYSQGAQENTSRSPRGRRSDGPCFGCGRYGHIRPNCPQRKR